MSTHMLTDSLAAGWLAMPYSLPTTNRKTYIFANVPGTISDIAFFGVNLGYTVINQYTTGRRVVTAATACPLIRIGGDMG